MLALSTQQRKVILLFPITNITSRCLLMNYSTTLCKQTKNEKKEIENPLSEVYSYMLRLSGLLSLFKRLSSQPQTENVAPRGGLTI